MPKKIGLLFLVFLFFVAGCTGRPIGQAPPAPSGENQNSQTPSNQAPTQPAEKPAAKAPEVAWPGSTEIRGDGGPLINVQEPQLGTSVKSPIKVRGLARVFEATLQVRLKDEQGNILAEKTVTASQGAPGIGEYTTDLPYGADQAGKSGFIEVLTYSPRDGAVDQLVSVRVELK